jgi:hypothetical protein
MGEANGEAAGVGPDGTRGATGVAGVAAGETAGVGFGAEGAVHELQP